MSNIARFCKYLANDSKTTVTVTSNNMLSITSNYIAKYKLLLKI